MLTKLSVWLIIFYQKYISPYKGFSCAYRVSTNGLSCSAYGKKVIQKHGFWTGYHLLQRRFYDCKWHSQWLQEHNDEGTYLRKALHKQRGVIDCDCSGCDVPDLPHCDTPNCDFKFCKNLAIFDACDVFDCCGPDSKKQNKRYCFRGKKDSQFEQKRDKKNLSLKKEPFLDKEKTDS